MLAEAVNNATPFASTVSGWIAPVLEAVTVGLLGWIGRTIMHIDRRVDRADRTLFPNDAPPLTDKVQQIATDVAVLKDRGERRVHPSDGTDG